jgi:hypothetical protein
MIVMKKEALTIIYYKNMELIKKKLLIKLDKIYNYLILSHIKK